MSDQLWVCLTMRCNLLKSLVDHCIYSRISGQMVALIKAWSCLQDLHPQVPTTLPRHTEEATVITTTTLNTDLISRDPRPTPSSQLTPASLQPASIITRPRWPRNQNHPSDGRSVTPTNHRNQSPRTRSSSGTPRPPSSFATPTLTLVKCPRLLLPLGMLWTQTARQPTKSEQKWPKKSI